MASGIHFPLFLVLVSRSDDRFWIHYPSADLQTPDLFLERKPLSEGARRAGWQGFHYPLDSLRDRLIPIAEGRLPKRRAALSAVTGETAEETD